MRCSLSVDRQPADVEETVVDEVVLSEPVPELPEGEPVNEPPAVDEPAPSEPAPRWSGEGVYVGNEPPEGYVIKGNERSKKYHMPEARATAAPSPRSGSTARRRRSRPGSSAPSAEPTRFVVRVPAGRQEMLLISGAPADIFCDFRRRR